MNACRIKPKDPFVTEKALKRTPAMKKWGFAFTLAIASIGILLFVFLANRQDYYHGIVVEFELDTPAEYEHSILEQYLEQYHGNLKILDDPLPHDYTLVFLNMSERKVKEISHSFSDVEYVRITYYVGVAKEALNVE